MKWQPNIKHFFWASAESQDVAEPLPLGTAPLVSWVPDQPADYSDESDDEMERVSVSDAENISHIVEPGERSQKKLVWSIITVSRLKEMFLK